MQIRLSDHFTYRKLLRFSFPSIMMMLFTSIYGIVDGYFVSNFGGKTAFAAINLIFPFLMILGSMGFMIGSGGCALVGKLLGEQRKDKANSVFSTLIACTVILGVAFAIIGIAMIRPIGLLLGADEAMLEACVPYGCIVLIGLPALMLQFEWQSFFVAAEKPGMGFYFTVASGVMNMVLDALLVGILKWGVIGAAVATVISQAVGGVIPLIWFARPNSGQLKLVRPDWDMRSFSKACGNGSSEFVSNISMSIVSILYNAQLMKYAGEDGIAAYGVLMYVSMIFVAIFIGYAVGTAPVVSYHFGAQNPEELKSLFRKSLRILGFFASCMLIAGLLLSRPFSALYVSYDEKLMEMTVRAFKIFSFTFPLAAVPIYGSSFFTALNDGFTSAVISFLRTIVFQIAAVELMPLLWGIDGIWFSLIAAEAAAAIITCVLWVKKGKRYMYL